MEDRSPALARTLVVCMKLMCNHLYIGKNLLYRIQPLEQSAMLPPLHQHLMFLWTCNRRLCGQTFLSHINQKQQMWNDILKGFGWTHHLKVCLRFYAKSGLSFSHRHWRRKSLDATFFKCLPPTFVCVQYVNVDWWFLGNFPLID